MDTDKIARRLKSRFSPEEIHAMSPTDIMQHIFDAGFSTKEAISLSSGRGIGLNAVKEEIEALGGSIRVSSTLGSGSTFILQVPVIWQKSQQ